MVVMSHHDRNLRVFQWILYLGHAMGSFERTRPPLRRAAILLFSVGLLGCGGGDGGGAPVSPPVTPPPPPPPAAVASVVINPETDTIYPSTTRALVATLRDAAGNVLTGRSVSWSSSTQSVATVSAAGLVTAVALGETRVSASSEGQIGTALIVVQPVPVGSVAITLPRDTMTVGERIRLVAVVRGIDGQTLAGRPVSWRSDAPDVATVSDSGQVTALAVGAVTLAAESGGQRHTVRVTVLAVPVASVSIEAPEMVVVPGVSVNLGLTLRTEDGTRLADRSVSWSSSQSAVVSVSASGRMTAHGAGSADVRVAVPRRAGSTDSVVATRRVVVGLGGVIGAQGGSVSTDRVSLTFPAGAVAEQTSITIRPNESPDQPERIVQGTAWALGPTPRTFSQSVTVALRWDAARLPVGVAARDLAVHRWNGTAWQALDNVMVDTVERVARGTTTTFSTFALLPVPRVLAWKRQVGHPGEAWGNSIYAWTNAAGRLWLGVGDTPPIFWSTADGETWESFNPTSVGLPPYRACGTAAGTCSLGSFVMTPVEDELLVMMLLYHGPNWGTNAAGHFGGLWTVRGRPGQWTVQGPTTTGLDQSKPSPSARNFRVTGLGSGAAWGSRVVVTTQAQWWIPFSTGGRHFASFSTNQRSSWSVFAQDEVPYGGTASVSIEGLAATPWGFEIMGQSATSAFRWRSANGLNWSSAPDPAAQFGGASANTGVVLHGAAGLIQTRTRSGANGALERLVYHSTNGSTWTEVSLGSGRSEFGRGLVLGERFVLYDNDGEFRVSRDGRTWSALPARPTSTTRVVGVGQRLYAFSSGQVWMLDLTGY
jgi:uncharacterized protein YjdB